MRRTIHLMIGAVATTVLLENIGIEPITFNGVTAYGVSAIASTIPDQDLRFKIPHRTITHSLLFLLLTTFIIYRYINVSIALIWGLNLGLHLAADSLTKMGIQFLWPYPKFMGLRKFRS